MLPRFIDCAAASTSGQQILNNIDQTYLVLPRGKLLLELMFNRIMSSLNSFIVLPVFTLASKHLKKAILSLFSTFVFFLFQPLNPNPLSREIKLRENEKARDCVRKMVGS